MQGKNIIYLDYAATAPTDPEVTKAMLPYFTEQYGNPSTVYSIGREVRAAVDEARESIAASIGAQRDEIIFTSGGTEANNFAIQGIFSAHSKKGNHIITTKIEHHAILEPLHYLEKNGAKVTYLPVDSDGLVNPEDVRSAITDQTILVTIMAANNEIGTLQPISEIARITKEKGVTFHTDAVQALGSVPLNVQDWGVDMLSIAGHKIYGPKGIGALYVKKGIKINPLIRGGAQERNRRAGTENTPAIIGFAKSVELAVGNLKERTEKIKILREKLIDGLFDGIDGIRLNGHRENRLPNNVNICIRGVEGESILLLLDMQGICVSSGSACTSGSLEPSHVLLSLGIPQEVAHGSIRFSLGKDTTEQEIETVLEALPPIIERLRAMSPYIQPEEYYVMKSKA